MLVREQKDYELLRLGAWLQKNGLMKSCRGILKKLYMVRVAYNHFLDAEIRNADTKTVRETMKKLLATARQLKKFGVECRVATKYTRIGAEKILYLKKGSSSFQLNWIV